MSLIITLGLKPHGSIVKPYPDCPFYPGHLKGFYNRRRKHSHLDYKSPEVFENAA